MVLLDLPAKLHKNRHIQKKKCVKSNIMQIFYYNFVAEIN